MRMRLWGSCSDCDQHEQEVGARQRGACKVYPRAPSPQAASLYRRRGSGVVGGFVGGGGVIHIRDKVAETQKRRSLETALHSCTDRNDGRGRNREGGCFVGGVLLAEASVVQEVPASVRYFDSRTEGWESYVLAFSVARFQTQRSDSPSLETPRRHTKGAALVASCAFESNHLSEGYYEALCTLGVKLAKLVLEDPGFFDGIW